MTETNFINQDALKAVLSTPQGRTVLWGILSISGLYQQPFAADQATTNFNCGRMNTGLITFAECLEASPDLTALMTKEQGNGERERAGRKPNSDKRAGTAAGPDDARAVGNDLDRPDDDAEFERDPNGLGFSR